MLTRRDRVLRELRAGLSEFPGVDGASFSQLGLFSGGVSTVGIEVEGSALTERAWQRFRVGSGGPALLHDAGDPDPIGTRHL